MKIIGANVTGSFILNNQDVTTTIQTSNVWSGSVATDITALNVATASLNVATISLNAATASLFNYTASNNAAIADILLETASFNAFSSSIFNYTASNNAAIADILLETASINSFTSSLNLATASLLSYTASQNSRNGTYATTGSNTFIGTQTITGSLNISSNITAVGTLTAQTLVVQTITSSQDFVTGSTRFGSLLANTHIFTGSVGITGSLNVNGIGAILSNQTSSMTVSAASTATSASYATNASTAVSATNATSASFASNGGVTSITAGTGISRDVSTGGVTITNSGVTSIVAGTNISISGGTGAVTITNGITNNNQLTNGAGYITSAGTSADSNLLNGISAVNLFNNMGGTHGTRTSFDASTPSYGFGFRYVQGSGNGPGTGGQYYSWYIGLGTDYGATGAGSYGAYFALNRVAVGGGNPYLAVRFNENNTLGSWSKIYAGYADSTALTNAPTYNLPAVRVTSNGSTSSGASLAIQQMTTEGWTGIFVDFEPYTGWGLYHDNPNNYFCVTSENATGGIRSFTVPSRESGNRTAYEKIRFDQNNGSILAGGDVTAFSDGRVKTEVKNIDNAIEKIKAIRGVTFIRTDAEGEAKNKRHAGVIAQEVLEVLPEVVNRDKNTGMYNVAYGNLNALLIEAIKEQQSQIEELKSIINGLTK